jgi:hypothetical protein
MPREQPQQFLSGDLVAPATTAWGPPPPSDS